MNNPTPHLTHCFQGEYEGSCKYGDSDCPANPNAFDPEELQALAETSSFNLAREVLRLRTITQAQPVAWEYRTWWDGGGGEPVGWGRWERLIPRGLQTMDDAVREMRDYIKLGYRYELRWLVAYPDIADKSNG